MATFSKHNSGWRAQVQKHGVRRSKVWPTKREAQDWAARQEYLIVNAEKVATEQSLSSLF